MKYGPFEKEIVRRLLQNISFEYNSRSNVSPDTFAWVIWQKIDYSLDQIMKYKYRQFLKTLEDSVPEKRGKEECDCSKGQHKCGCRVSDFNQAIDEFEYAINLVREELKDS